MRSYTTMLNLYQSLTSNTTTDNQTLGAQLINDSIRTVSNMRGGRWPWLEFTTTVNTSSSNDYIIVPASVEKIADLYVTVDTSTIYTPTPISDSWRWKQILASQLGSSDWALYFYRQGNKVFIQPAPASANPVTIRARRKIRDLSIADYTTGTITTATSGSTTIVGSGTSWTASMAGRWIRIAESDTANKGDGQWYEIASVTNTTTLVLVAPYEGTSIAVGTATYTIGQMSVIPEPYDLAPVYRAVALYWQSKDNDKYLQYMMQYDGGYEAGKQRDEPGGLVGQLIEAFGETSEGAYISPDINKNNIPGNAPYWFPYQDASGF